ncbi:unnamed protein product [Peronospora belbahrii]|uniref:Uncharacterized protein n=1 Tax=Peronospora belbahrii TaxID=622444 RepID=A0ABN8CNL5_9STRA|nr:unnamed protein product [Peronospora belbahrii]
MGGIVPLNDKEQFELSPPLGSKLQPGEKLGHALIELKYMEHKEDLLFCVRASRDGIFSEREDRDFFSRITADYNQAGLAGALKSFFEGLMLTTPGIISWKNKKKSAVCFATFVCNMCLLASNTRCLTYVVRSSCICCIGFHLRLEGAYVARWIGYEEYEFEQEEQQKLYRPLMADLHAGYARSYIYLTRRTVFSLNRSHV